MASKNIYFHSLFKSKKPTCVTNLISPREYWLVWIIFLYKTEPFSSLPFWKTLVWRWYSTIIFLLEKRNGRLLIILVWFSWNYIIRHIYILLVLKILAKETYSFLHATLHHNSNLIRSVLISEIVSASSRITELCFDGPEWGGQISF